MLVVAQVHLQSVLQSVDIIVLDWIIVLVTLLKQKKGLRLLG